MIPDEIERIANLGWAVFPCSHVSRAMMFAGADKAATCDLNVIESWCAKYPGSNWRVSFGLSGLWGFDLDVPPLHAHDGIKAMTELAKVHGGLPRRPQARSGGGGLGLYFRHDGEPLIGKDGIPAPGMDIRRGLQTQTVPPSIHIDTRKPYVWVTAPWDVPPPPAPEWLLRLVRLPPEPERRPAPKLREGTAKRNYAVTALHSATRLVASTGEGGRNNILNRECWSVARFIEDGTLSESEVRDCMVAAATAAGLNVRDACLTIDSAIRSKRK